MKKPDRERIWYLRTRILRWFGNHGRDYPWRREGDPFRLLLAEMLLRKTQACQVERVYVELVSRYGTPQKLSEADTEDLEDLLCSLGLTSRIPMLKEAGETIYGEFGNRVPDSRKTLKKIKGVGDYTAGVYLAQAHGRQEWFVDGNIARIFIRFLALRVAPHKRSNPRLVECAKTYMKSTKPRKATMAILDFGALVCSPKKPRCSACPVKKECRSNQGSPQ